MNKILLISTIGGSPEPIVFSLVEWKPLRVWFVCTPQSKATIQGAILPKARDSGFPLDSGRYDLLLLSDGERFADCIEQLRRLTPEVEQWVGRDQDHGVVVDFSGGTKCMSAAIALHARRWPCKYSYVGGHKRTKDGLGVVVSGNERICRTANPWNVLGYQATEDFVTLFDEGAFRSAGTVAKQTKENATSPGLKREFSVLENLATAFDSWDRFDHKQAAAHFKSVLKGRNDLRQVLGSRRAEPLLHKMQELQNHLDNLHTTQSPTRSHILDLLSNADRRRREGRFDDAVARLYRAVEGIGQLALKEDHTVESTSKVPLDLVPATLRSEWEPRAKDGRLALGLQDNFRLLAELGNPVGKKFEELRLGSKESPLSVRNNSILAHGFDPVRDKTCRDLWSAALQLGAFSDNDVPSFPPLGKPPPP